MAGVVVDVPLVDVVVDDPSELVVVIDPSPFVDDVLFEAGVVWVLPSGL